MVEIADVRDLESLQAYLDGLEGDGALLTARRAAFRAAARLLPLALRYFLSEKAAGHDFAAVPVFGALATGAAASVWPAPTIDRAAANHAADAAMEAEHAAANAAVNADAAAAYAAKAAAYAANAVATDAAANAAYATNAANKAAAAANALAAADAVWHAVRDDLRNSLKKANHTLPALWQDPQEPEDLKSAWKRVKRQMQADRSADWSFWILWYERVRAGRDFHADKLSEILNTLRKRNWKKGPAHINPLFDHLLAIYREEDAELEAESTPLSQAYFADFSFDALAKVMVMIGIDNDTAHLRAPEVVQAFLDDSVEARDLLQDFADDARALSGGNYAGVLQRKAEKLLSEFRRAGESTHLRARTIVTFCGDLELHAQEEMARNDLGKTLSKQLDQRIGLLKRLCMQHFGPAYLALAPLAEMPHDHVDQAEVIRLLDLALEQMRAPTQDGFIVLDPEGVAVFKEMIRGLEATRAAIAASDSEEFRALLESRFAQSSGSIGVTALRYFEKSVVAGGQTADALIKANKQVSGLQDILDRVKDWLPGGGP